MRAVQADAVPPTCSTWMFRSPAVQDDVQRLRLGHLYIGGAEPACEHGQFLGPPPGVAWEGGRQSGELIQGRRGVRGVS